MSIGTFIPSLERLCVIRINITLWSSENALCNIIAQNENWSDVTDHVQANTTQLPLPAASICQKHLQGLVQPIGEKLQKWCQEFVYKSDPLPIVNPDRIRPYFTQIRWYGNIGTIDMVHTAKMVCRDEEINPITRYRVAGFYCQEDEILRLWPLVDNKSCYIDPLWETRPDPVMTAYWSYFKAGDTEGYNSWHWPPPSDKYEFAVWVALNFNNETATKFFWKKLSPEDKSNSLWDLNVSPCLFLQMTEAEITDLLKNKQKYAVLKNLLEWPYQDLFLQVMTPLVQDVPFKVHCDMVDELLNKIRNNACDFIWRYILTAYWKMSGLRLQLSYVVTKSFYQLGRYEMQENFDSVANDAGATKDVLTLKGEDVYVCPEALMDGSWSFDTLLGHCVEGVSSALPEDQLSLLKSVIAVYLKCDCPGGVEALKEDYDKYFFSRPNIAVCPPRRGRRGRPVEEEPELPL